MEKKVYFKNTDGLKLCGVLTKPEEETEKCIVLGHGITVTKDESGAFSNLAQDLSKEGFAVFRFDFRAHGESEGESVKLTVSAEKRDLEAAFEYLQGLGYKNFGLLGASFAGGAVSLFAGENEENLKALVLWNALIDYHSILEPELPWPRENFGLEAMQRLEKQGYIEIGSRGFRIGRSLFEEIKNLEPWKKLKGVNIPILFVHGDKDTYVPYEDSVKYSKMMDNAKLVTIEGAEHGLHDKKSNAEKTDKKTIRFFLDNIM